MDWVRSPLPLFVVGLGALLAAAAFVTRRRSRAQLGA
jgi:LPXTG-motif cell wall-anchored protein